MNDKVPQDKLKFHQHKHVRIPAYALAVLIAVPLMAFAVFYARLSAGPVAVPFVGSAIERAVNRTLEGEYVISVSGAVLEPGEESLVALRLTDMFLFNRSGKLVGVAPFATAELDLLSLTSMQPRAHSITFLGPVMVLKWGRSGQVELVPGLVPGQRPPENAQVAPALPTDEGAQRELLASSGDFLTTGLSRALRQAFANMPVSADGLTRLEVKNAILRVEHEETGAIWRVAPINFTSRADPGERVFEVDASVLEGAQPWSVRGRVSGVSADSEKRISVGVSNLVLASATGPLARFSGIPLNVPLSSQFSGRLMPDGQWQDMEFDASLGRGLVNLGPGKQPLDFNGAVMQFARVGSQWQIRHFDVEVADTTLSLSGTVADGGEDRYDINLNASYRAEGETDFTRNLPEAQARIQGVIDLAARAIDLDTLEIETPDVTLAADAHAEWQPDGVPQAMLVGTASQINSRDLKAIWPAFVLPETRSWIYDHLIGGVASDIFYRLGIDSSGKLVRQMEATVSEASFTYFRDLPPVEGARGRLLLEDDLFSATLETGHVEPVPGGQIDLAGTVWRTVLTPRGQPDLATLAAQVKGDAAPVFYYLDSPALGLLRENGLDLDNLAGSITGEATLSFPIKPEVNDDELVIEVRARAEDFEADGLMEGKRLTEGRFTFTQNGDGLTLEGGGKLEGAALALTAQRALQAGSPLRYNAVITLDGAARKAFGLDLGEAVSGPVRAVFSGEGRELPRSFDIDLTAAMINLEQIGYQKGAGVSAQASVTYREDGDAIIIEALRYDQGPVAIEGTARISRNGDILSASLPVFRFQEGDDLSLTLTRQRGAYAIDVRGARFNVEPFLSATSSGPPRERQPFSLKASIGAATGANGQIIRNVTLSMRHDGEYVRDLLLEGEHGDGGTLRGWQEGLVFHVESLNAGSLLRFADTYSNMLGGRLQLHADQKAAGTDGWLKINDFTIINDRVVETIAAANSRNEQLQALRTAAQEGLAFTSMSANYSYGRNKMLSIDDGKVKGPTAGATIEGTINMADGRIDMQGTFVPAYALNNAFSQIPIFGRILGGDKDEGLVGINFDVRGTTEAPEVNVQPLSVLTPGIFRRIFE